MKSKKSMTKSTKKPNKSKRKSYKSVKINSLQDLIDYYEKIPENKWCKGAYTKGEKHCALGHLGFRSGAMIMDVNKKLKKAKIHGIDLVIANDDDAYTPKQNVLKYLKELQNENK